jgi:hypothetical protein
LLQTEECGTVVSVWMQNIRLSLHGFPAITVVPNSPHGVQNLLFSTIAALPIFRCIPSVLARNLLPQQRMASQIRSGILARLLPFP